MSQKNIDHWGGAPYASDGYIISLKTICYVIVLLIAAPPPGAAADPGLRIELNKLEEVEGACRAYLMFENRTEHAYQSLKLDLVMFGQDGVITKRLAVEGGPLSRGKTSVKLFEIAGLNCDSIARVLLNDVIECRDNTGEIKGCVDAVSTSSKNQVDFFK